MSSVLLLSYINVMCVDDTKLKALKSVVHLCRIESAFSRIRQETVKRRYTLLLIGLKIDDLLQRLNLCASLSYILRSGSSQDCLYKCSTRPLRSGKNLTWHVFRKNFGPNHFERATCSQVARFVLRDAALHKSGNSSVSCTIKLSPDSPWLAGCLLMYSRRRQDTRVVMSPSLERMTANDVVFRFIIDRPSLNQIRATCGLNRHTINAHDRKPV